MPPLVWLTRFPAGDTMGFVRSLSRRSVMAKILRCGDLMPGCSFVAEGKDVAEVMAKGAEHAKTAHGKTAIPPDVARKAETAIKDKYTRRTPLPPRPAD